MLGVAAQILSVTRSAWPLCSSQYLHWAMHLPNFHGHRATASPGLRLQLPQYYLHKPWGSARRQDGRWEAATGQCSYLGLLSRLVGSEEFCPREKIWKWMLESVLCDPPSFRQVRWDGLLPLPPRSLPAPSLSCCDGGTGVVEEERTRERNRSYVTASGPWEQSRPEA